MATGSYWTRTRISEAVDGGPDDAEALCQRCGLGVRETPLHRFWCCPGNAAIDGLEGAELQVQAVREADEWPCFWLRGLTPAPWTAVPRAPEDPEPWDWSEGADLPEGSGTQWWGAGDGSGGVHSADPRLRRAGWAYVLVAAGADAKPPPDAAREGNAKRGRGGGLPGSELQSVNRAELRALLEFVLAYGGPGRDLHYVVDSEYVERGWGKGCARRRRTHKDLWMQLETAMASCGANLFLHKVESHLSEGEARQRGEDPLHWAMNAVADRLAEQAAQRRAAAAEDVERVQGVDERARKVRGRLAAVLRAAGDADPRPRRVPPERTLQATPFERALRDTHHRVSALRGGARGRGALRLRCLTCWSEACGTRASCTAWLRTACGGPPLRAAAGPVAARGPAAAPRAPAGLQVGGQCPGPDHDLRAHPAVPVWFCARCGACSAREGGVLRRLAGPCLQPGARATQSGREALVRLDRGLWPGASAAARAWNAGRYLREGVGRGRRG